VDPVGAADRDGLAVLERPCHERVAVVASPGGDDRPRLDELGGERGVEHVGGGQPVVQPATLLADRVLDHVDERGDIVVGGALALLNRLDGELGPLPAGAGRRLGHHPLDRQRLGHGELDLEPGLHLAALGPDAPDRIPCVAGDHLRSR
jgi:hypothetical protein